MKLKFKRKAVNIIDLILKSVGINVHQQTTPFYKFYQFGAVFPHISAFIHMSLHVFINRQNITQVVILAAFLGASAVLLASIGTLLQKKDKILKMLQIMDKNVYSYPDGGNTNFNIGSYLDEEKSTKVLFFILGYECFGFSLSLLSPLFAYLITGFYEASIYPGWYPLFEKPILSTITFVLQLSGCISTFWLYYIIQIFITFITIEFLRQYHRLQITLSSIQRRTAETVLRKMQTDSWYSVSHEPTVEFEISFKRRYDKTYRDNVLHCVLHHQQLWRLFRLFGPWFTTFYSMELAMSATTFALVFNNLLSARNPSTILTIVGSTFNLGANMFSRCVVGEVFVEMNTSIRNTIFYDTDWWQQSIENRNLLILFHKMTERTYEFKGCYIYTASYYTFVHLIRISYSYFNIIRSSLKN